MFREIGSVFSFLTIIPANNTNIETVAKLMYIFPIVGILIGLMIGSFAFGISLILDPLIVSLLVVAALSIITGIHHTDGLADFADGLMTKGKKEKKLKAMKDISTGSAGTVSIVLYIIGMIIVISLMTGFVLFQAILLSEVLAKFSMVLSKNTNYRFSICNHPDSEGEAVLQLYDMATLQGATYMESLGKDFPFFDFKCQKTGVYHIFISFQEGKSGKAVGILSYVQSL